MSDQNLIQPPEPWPEPGEDDDQPTLPAEARDVPEGCLAGGGDFLFLVLVVLACCWAIQ